MPEAWQNREWKNRSENPHARRDIFALVVLSVAALGAFSESTRAAGMGLFQYVADSYLVMFVDRLSTTFICF